MRLYWDDNSDFPPGIKNSAIAPFGYWTGYKELMKSYVGLSGPSSSSDTLFACPVDKFYYDFLSLASHRRQNSGVNPWICEGFDSLRVESLRDFSVHAHSPGGAAV
jgi:hypothetical protein